MMKMPRQGDHRLREFRTSPITDPVREFVFQVIDDRHCTQGTVSNSAVHGHARVEVREDPQRRGRVLVTAWGDNIRVVWRRGDE